MTTQAALLRAAVAERIPRDPKGCLRCDGRVKDGGLFCSYCVKDLPTRGGAR